MAEADIRWTTHGVAHIRADDWSGLGYGQGYCCARDHLPAIADQVVKVRSERAKYFGLGPDGNHAASDFGYLALGVRQQAAVLRDAQPAHIRALISGYAAGYNRWVAEAHGTDALPAWCRDAEWIRPLDELDLYTYLVDVPMFASGRNLVGLIGRAEAPGPDGPVAPSPLGAMSTPNAASNGWAMGGDVTASGHGMVLANPHFPWYGEARFWECHLTIPGELDVYGVSLLGIPGVQIGFNEHVGWTHTFSRGHRFTAYRLDLVPGAPTRYRYGDDEREMVAATHAIEVANDAGPATALERTLWSTHYGPMLNLPLLGWGNELGFTYRDANLDNTATVAQFLGMCQATDLDSFRRVFVDVKGMPWANTLATDRSGRVWYSDASATPRLSPGAQQRFTVRVTDDLIAALLYQNRVALLDGSDPDDEWLDVPGARAPGLEPPEALPELERRDYVINANDSHWLSNADAPLEGFNVLCGFERTPRTLRTRQNLAAAGALAERGSVTRDDMLETLWSNTSLSADLLVDDVVKRCRGAGTITVEGHETDLDRVAAILETWDRRYDLTSIGAVLWREFMSGFADAQWTDVGPLFAVGFDAADAVGTPHSLAAAPGGEGAGGDDAVLHAIGHAVRVLDAAGVALDAPLGDVQWAARGAARIAVHGGMEGEGMLNVLGPVGALPAASLEPTPSAPVTIPGRERTGLGEGGYQVSYGTSFVMAVELTDVGPVATGLLAYGQSGDTRSPHHADGTEAYASKTCRPLLFRDADIESDPQIERLRINSASS